jgi:hypothetical protein
MPAVLRHDWSREEVLALFDLPFPELMARAGAVHREHFDPCEVQVSTLLSVKTGGCPEDCAYCPQSARFDTGLKTQKLLPVDEVVAQAKAAQAAGATRFCMGAAWRSPKDKDVAQVAQMVGAVKALGLETCATLGMLTGTQAQTLKGEPACCRRWPRCPSTRARCRSTGWCRWRARRCTARPCSTPSNSCGPSQSRACSCPSLWSGCPQVVPR